MLRAAVVALLLPGLLAEGGVEQDYEVGGVPPEDPNLGALEAAKDDATPNSLVDEWDKHMEGFTPELLLTFPLPGRSDEFFYEDIPENSPPVLIRGGFFASASEETSTVEFSIHDPKGNVIFEKKDQAEGLFHFIAKRSGTYTFIVSSEMTQPAQGFVSQMSFHSGSFNFCIPSPFANKAKEIRAWSAWLISNVSVVVAREVSNHRWMEEKMVTFAVGKGNETHLQPQHLESMEDTVKWIEKTLVDIQTESTYLWIRQKSHMKAVENIHTRVLSFCVVEFLILIGVSGFQVYYIKGLLSDRRVL
ncbi:unnamed protein product [Durusdinium trenchii]|uniref:GOLD domain-containing protein n=1 Tax=Durusdinium trenchii TaxID=1381693 RepID=A0ABP0IJB5_9DINO